MKVHEFVSNHSRMRIPCGNKIINALIQAMTEINHCFDVCEYDFALLLCDKFGFQ